MNPGAVLTKRESEVAEWLAWGATKKEIANALYISVRTVENTARSIYEKTGVSKASELSAWWFCTHFHISFNLSPFVRSVLAFALLLVLLPKELTSQSDPFRVCRRVVNSRNVKTARSGRRAESDFIF